MRSLIDSHVHLWPESAANEDGHAWMTPGMALATPHILSDYCRAANQLNDQDSHTKVDGIVYVETDRRYDNTAPTDELASWAHGPLNEIRFLRSIVESDNDASGSSSSSSLLAGIVLWAPLHCSPAVLAQWLDLAESTAGPATWRRVKGFRFLLQAIHSRDEFARLVLSDAFIANLQLLGRRRFSFDVGIDQHSGGAWQLELMAQAMAAAHAGVDESEQTAFILDHLCKPDFSPSRPGYDRWMHSMSAFSSLERTYVKLSGALSELPSNGDALPTATEVATSIRDWVAHVFACFGARRIMFGSDWPVCSLKFPGEGVSWGLWRDVVEMLLSDEVLGLDEAACEAVWRETARDAYRLGG